MKKHYIDNGFYRISSADARKLAQNKLPAHGRERLVEHEGARLWLARTRVDGEQVWSVRAAL